MSDSSGGFIEWISPHVLAILSFIGGFFLASWKLLDKYWEGKLAPVKLEIQHNTEELQSLKSNFEEHREKMSSGVASLHGKMDVLLGDRKK